MSIFNSLLGKILGLQTPAAAPNAPTPKPTEPQQGGQSATTATATPVDVEAALNHLASQRGEPLDWRHSIVDLLKLVGMDSSLNARKELAAELHYPGDPSDSAAMNVWLHKAVLQKIAENGGHVPEDLLH